MAKKSTLPPCLTACVETQQRDGRLPSWINKACWFSLQEETQRCRLHCCSSSATFTTRSPSSSIHSALLPQPSIRWRQGRSRHERRCPLEMTSAVGGGDTGAGEGPPRLLPAS